MPKLSEVMATPASPAPAQTPPSPAAAPPGQVKLSQVMGTAPPIFDIGETVHVRPTPQQDALTLSGRPDSGTLEYVRWKRPELVSMPDQQLAAAIRRTYYPDMDPVEFYRLTGLAERFGYDTTRPDPTADMSAWERGNAGAGKSLVDLFRGGRQLGAEALNQVGLVDDDTVADLRRQETQRREADAPLMATTGGKVGYVIGALVPTLTGGAALRGTMAGRALLPASVAGNAASGAAYGALQPVAEGESRTRNVLTSALFGGGATAGLKAGGAAINAGRRLMPAVTERAQTRAAGEVLEHFAQDPAALRQTLAQPGNVIVAGTRPTTAEVTEDVGLGGLQRFLGNTPEFAGELTLRNEANNAARVAHIENKFGGANASAAERLTAARDLAARQALRPINSIGVDIDPVRRAITRIGIRHESARPVREAMSALEAELPRVRTVGDAHNLRREIDRLMSGQVEGQQGAKFAQAQLATVRGILDRQMRQAFPEWGRFLRDYKAASREIGQINTGETLLGAGPNVRAVGDIPQLSPAKFAGAVDDLDRIVRGATGFKRATAAKTLTAEQIKAAEEVRRDLERFARTQQRGLPVRSDTMANAIGGNRVQDALGPFGVAMIDPASGAGLLFLNAARKKYGENVAVIVREAMLDPERAAEVLATLPPAQRREIVAALGLAARGTIEGTARTLPALSQ